MVARSSLRTLRPATAARRVGLVVRVSTDMQARNPEGSLTTQLQRLRQQIALKQANGGPDWTEVAVYELRAISGKHSVRSKEFERLYDDVRAGRVNTVMFTALSRLCRSVKDFLGFVEFLETHGSNFISLKEDYDTTTAQGRLIITIMMALAEFEREQTGERTRDAFQARTERGLWNGGRLVGYDLDPIRKGYLIPNEAEVALVNFAFDTYLDCASMVDTTTALNSHGYRTKSYKSRREVEHPGKEFALTTVQHLLKNVSYIAKKLVCDDAGEHLVNAVWPPIVDQEKFDRVQALLAANGRTKHNGATPVRHAHILSRGLLVCGRCRSPMQGRSGTGRGGSPYFYYVCTGSDCGLRVVAAEVEDAVIARIGALASDETTVTKIVETANGRLQRQLPAMEKQLRAQQRSLKGVRAEAEKLLCSDGAGSLGAGRSFLTDRLDELSRRREELESASRESENQIADCRQATLDPIAVREGLANFHRVYAHLKPFERQELIRLILHRAEISDRELVLEIYKGACAFTQAPKSDTRFERPIWLPGRDSNPEPIG